MNCLVAFKGMTSSFESLGLCSYYRNRFRGSTRFGELSRPKLDDYYCAHYCHYAHWSALYWKIHSNVGDSETLVVVVLKLVNSECILFFGMPQQGLNRPSQQLDIDMNEYGARRRRRRR
ncbi:hypothetical protein BLOT_004089 [Blomia tropicalis]|nr:hypothetical protein BLOT_004089 [Blomia tropicalis]